MKILIDWIFVDNIHCISEGTTSILNKCCHIQSHLDSLLIPAAKSIGSEEFHIISYNIALLKGRCIESGGDLFKLDGDYGFICINSILGDHDDVDRSTVQWQRGNLSSVCRSDSSVLHESCQETRLREVKLIVTTANVEADQRQAMTSCGLIVIDRVPIDWLHVLGVKVWDDLFHFLSIPTEQMELNEGNEVGHVKRLSLVKFQRDDAIMIRFEGISPCLKFSQVLLFGLKEGKRLINRCLTRVIASLRLHREGSNKDCCDNNGIGILVPGGGAAEMGMGIILLQLSKELLSNVNVQEQHNTFREKTKVLTIFLRDCIFEWVEKETSGVQELVTVAEMCKLLGESYLEVTRSLVTNCYGSSSASDWRKWIDSFTGSTGLLKSDISVVGSPSILGDASVEGVGGCLGEFWNRWDTLLQEVEIILRTDLVTDT